MENEILDQNDYSLNDGEKQPSPWKVAIKWGLIGGLGLVIINLLSFVMKDNFFNTGGLDLLIQIIAIVTPVILAQNEHKNNDLHGKMSYGRALGVGVIVSLFSGFILALWSAILYNIILSPEELEMGVQFGLEKGIEIMEKFGMEITDEMIELQEREVRKSFRPMSQIISLTLTMTFIGFIISLITSIFTKKK